MTYIKEISKTQVIITESEEFKYAMCTSTTGTLLPSSHYKVLIWDKHIVVHTTIFFYRGDHAHEAKSEKEIINEPRFKNLEKLQKLSIRSTINRIIKEI